MTSNHDMDEVESDADTVVQHAAITMNNETHNVVERDEYLDRQTVSDVSEVGTQRRRYPPKGSAKFGIKKSLEKMSVKYVPPKAEEPKLKHACAPCSREYTSKKAATYCSECQEKLCSKCTTQHRKFQILQTHTIIPVQEAPQPDDNDSDKPKPRLTELCAIHAGKVVNLYCSRHDEVVCPTCISTSHSECPRPILISNVAAELMKPQTIKTGQSEIATVKKDILAVKLKRIGEKDKLLSERDAILTTIDGVKSRFFETLDKFETEAKEKLNRKFSKDMRIIKRDVNQCEHASSALDDALKKTKTNDTRLLMIHMKRDVKQSVQRGKKVVDNVTARLGNVGTQFTLDEGVQEWLKNWMSIGYFAHEETVFTSLTVGEFELKQSSDPDSMEYVFNNMVSIRGGNVVICDWKNRRLLLLDDNYKLHSRCETIRMPYSACCVNQTLIAVTIRDEKLLQFVNVESGEMKLEGKFKMDEYCRGIAYKGNLLYITCGGEGEIQGQVRVYTMQGQLMRTYVTDKHERPLFLQPKDIAINSDGTRLYVLDTKKGVVTFTQEGRLVNTFKDADMKAPLGMCIDGMGNVFVSDRDANTVVQLNADGSKLGVVLKESDGLINPLTICCQAGMESRLLVAMENSSTIHVFTIQEKK